MKDSTRINRILKKMTAVKVVKINGRKHRVPNYEKRYKGLEEALMLKGLIK